MDAVCSRVGRDRIYAITGIQFLAFNTAYQLVAALHTTEYASAHRLLMVPDLVNLALCGSTTNDITNASTTQLLDVGTRSWSDELVTDLGLRRDLLPELHEPGTDLGTVRGVDPAVVLGFESDFEVVGEAADGAQAIELAGRMRPDIVLLDVEMPLNVPAETVRGIRAVSPGSRVIMLTMHDAPQLVRDMVESGVAGYLHKSIGRQALTAAIRGALEAGGGGRRLVMSVTHGSLLADQSPSRLISPRERQILVLVAAAFSNRQIASRLSITEATVKRHLRNAFEKLGAVSRIDAVNRAAAAGLIHTRPMRHSVDARRGDPMATA